MKVEERGCQQQTKVKKKKNNPKVIEIRSLSYNARKQDRKAGQRTEETEEDSTAEQSVIRISCVVISCS